MRRRLIAILALWTTQAALAIGGEPPLQAILELAPGASIAAVAEDYDLTLLASIPSRRLHLLEMGESADLEALGQTLGDDPRVIEAEINDDCLAPEAVGGDTQPFFFYVPPADYADQYSTAMVGLGDAQAQSTGDGIVVAVLDTGISAGHELLAWKVLPVGYNFVDGNLNTSDVPAGLDIDGDGLLDEMTGHGTHVAGIIATIAPDANMVPVKVLDSEGATDVFRLVQGIYYAIALNVDVINLSLSTKNHNHILRDAVEDAIDAGIVVVAAVGNDNKHMPVPMPAGEESVLGVAATDDQDLKTPFTNYGDYVALSAPGWEIVSSVPGGGYAQASGTSLSTAMVAGAAALLRAADPTAGPSDIANALLAAAHDIDAVNPAFAGTLGAGRLDIDAAITALLAPPGPFIGGPAASFCIGPAAGAQ